MPTSTAGSRLAALTFTDPQHDAGVDATWSSPASAARELPSAPATCAWTSSAPAASRGLEEWVAETSSTSLLVLDEGTVVHEWYADGLGPDTRFLGASMTKSVLAHLVGRAVRDGALALTDAVTDHVPGAGGHGLRRHHRPRRASP